MYNYAHTSDVSRGELIIKLNMKYFDFAFLEKVTSYDLDNNIRTCAFGKKYTILSINKKYTFFITRIIMFYIQEK